MARRLVAEGWEVTGTGRNYRVGAALEAMGVRMVYADLTDGAAMGAACEGQDFVFHCAALSAPWGKHADFYNANVVGTQNVVAGCLASEGTRLIHVSTPSLYFRNDSRLNVREDARFPLPVNAYTLTKLAAEKVLHHKRHHLSSIIIRPRAVFGPGDTSLLPRLLPRLAKGRLPIIGDGENVVDLTYIDNVVEALWCCVHAPQAAWGRAYNVTNGEPVKLWVVIAHLAEVLGYPPLTRKVSAGVAFGLAGLLESTWRTLHLWGEPPLTLFAVAALVHSTTLDITAAREVLGYAPVVGMEEALERTVASLQNG